MKVLSRDVMHSMPWKNGGGITTEIARASVETTAGDAEPDRDQFHNLFLWRFSTATVETSGPFSRFENYDRALMVLGEAGLELNGRVTLPYVAFHFRGEDEIWCRPLDAKVKDLGVIYQRGKFEVEMEVLSQTDARQLPKSVGEGSTYFVFDPKTENAWRFDPGATLEFSAFRGDDIFILVRIRSLSLESDAR